MHVSQWDEGRWKDLLMDTGMPKRQPHQIILAHDLTALNFNGILTIDFFETQSNHE